MLQIVQRENLCEGEVVRDLKYLLSVVSIVVITVIFIVIGANRWDSVEDKNARCRSVGGHYSVLGTGKCYINGEEVFKDE